MENNGIDEREAEKDETNEQVRGKEIKCGHYAEQFLRRGTKVGGTEGRVNSFLAVRRIDL